MSLGNLELVQQIFSTCLGGARLGLVVTRMFLGRTGKPVFSSILEQIGLSKALRHEKPK